MRISTPFILGILIPFFAFGKVRLPTIFSDYLVFQQKSGNPIWGWAEPGDKVTVSTTWGSKESVTAGEDGSWKVISYTQEPGVGHEVSIQGSNQIVLKEVAVGEVWLLSLIHI